MPAVSPRKPVSEATSNGQVLVGTGFLALDLLYRNSSSRASRRYAGGSFGNVMAILSFLGWKSYPVARLGSDRNARSVIDDLQDFRVDTKFVRRTATGSTPLIVVRVVKSSDGSFKSKFEWRHPNSGERLPSYRPLPQFIAREVSPDLPRARVFYFDRAEPSSLLLANEMRSKGALVFFEPSSCRDERIFAECMKVSDIVKYSDQRIREAPFDAVATSPRLEIQTLGEVGLRYRLKSQEAETSSWRNLPSMSVPSFKDATGCGDWCSAGLLHKVGKRGRQSFLKMSESDVVSGLNFGQALSSLNCEFEGARGPMYSLSPRQLASKVSKILQVQLGNGA